LCAFQLCLLALVHLRAALLAFAGDELPADRPRPTTRQTSDASGSVIQWDSYVCSLILTQPQSVGEGSAGAGSSAWPQTCPPSYMACRTCCLRAALVGSVSWTLFFIANSLQRALLTSLEVHACPVIEQDDEPLYGLRGIFIYLSWCSGEVNEDLCELRHSCPHFPCRRLASAGEEGDHVAPC